MNPKLIFLVGLALLLVVAIYLGAQMGDGQSEVAHQPVVSQKKPTASPKQEQDIVPPTPSDALAPPIEMTPAAGLTENQVKALGELTQILEAGEVSPDAILQPIRDWADRDPRACALWITQNLRGAARQRCLEEALACWAEKNPKDALAFLAALGSPEGNEGAYANVLSTLARQNPSAAADWLRQNPGLGALENWQTIFSAWADSNPGQAMTWMRQNLDANMKDGLLPTLLSRFRDPTLQSELLAGTDPVRRQQSLADAAKASAHDDPAYAISLARLMADSGSRDAATNEILRDWHLRDASAASAFAEQNGLVIPKLQTQ
jgi:hypothetical protein